MIAAKLAEKAPPIDGVTISIVDLRAIEDDARYATSLGFGGKLLIHPAQVAPAREGLMPSETEVIWARKIVTTVHSRGSAVAVDGLMVDTPVVARAERILRRAGII